MNRKYIYVIICCCLYIGACFGTSNAQGAFIVPLTEKTHSLRGTVSMASTIYGIISGFCTPLVMKSVKKYPLKYILLFAGVSMSLLTTSFGFMTNIWVYLAANVIKGFINAFFNSAVILIIIGNWFADLRSTVTAVVLGFSGIAGAFFSPLFSHMVNTYGLTAGFLTQAFFQLVLSLPAALTLSLTPAEQNTVPYQNASRKAEKSSESEDSESYPFSLKDPVFFSLCGVSILTAILFQISNHYNGYAQSIGRASVGPLMVSAIMIGNIFFKFTIGMICDRFGNRYGVPALCICGISGCALLLTASSSALMIAGAFMMGAVYANQVTTPALIREAYGNKQYAQVYGAQAVPYGLMYLGNMIFGYIYDFTGSYKPCFILGIIFLTVAFLLNQFILRKTARKSH